LSLASVHSTMATSTSEQLTDTITNLLKAAYELRVSDIHESIKLTEKALFKSQKIKESQPLHVDALNQLALLQMINGEFKTAISLSNKAIRLSETIDYVHGVASANFNIASCHYKSDNYHEGLQYLLDCLIIFRDLEDYENQSRVLKSIGTIYELFGDLKNAIDSYREAVEAAQKINHKNLESNAYNPLSGIYLKLGRNVKALNIIEESIKLKKETNDVRGLGFALYGRGKVYLKTKKHKEALKDLEEALSIFSETDETVGIAMAKRKLGILFFRMNDHRKAEIVLYDAYQRGTKINNSLIRFKSCYALYEIYKLNGQTEKALEFLELYSSIKEKVINTHTVDIIHSYEALSKIELIEKDAEMEQEKATIIEKKNTELDSFFYRVSHDLKGPISSLIGLSNLASKDVTDPQAKHYLKMYDTQVRRMNSIVMELINITQLNYMEVKKTRINFYEIIDNCISSYKYLPKFESINFTIDIGSNIKYHSEWYIVNTIFQNLIENSIKYADSEKEQPFVTIRVVSEKSTLKLIVEDNGLGMEPIHQQKIFDMFYRASEQADGTGLGLFILKRAVERLNGKIDVDSELNRGSKFTITLPLELS
jgi:signal transduction histidine kinase